MNAPIPVSEALKLLSMAIEDCDKATPVHPHAPASTSPDQAFNDLARATMRPMIEFLQGEILAHEKGYYAIAGVRPDQYSYPPLAALRDHYTQTRPDWRTR